MTETAINWELKHIDDKIKHLESIVDTATKTGSLGMIERTRQIREEILREFSIVQEQRDTAVAALNNKTKLSIPKKIAEELNQIYEDMNEHQTNVARMICSMEPYFDPESFLVIFLWLESDENNRNLMTTYLAGKVLGVELVEVECE
ncbi:hypothetical protein COC69_05830 [Bacillus cereus]|uniref:Uncharacterized protein n=1 Tax=Bacillus cereus TaxID=1396 RepID=A0A9X7CQS1_BACCE|nr:hypothetical protein [Bacillus cereus]PGS81648.1 hypothetical protein COC69_05830 [Bacillus cereus]